MPISTSTLIAHTHNFLPLLLCIGDLFPVISTPSPTPTPIVTPIDTRPRLRPLLTPITSFRSSGIYIYCNLSLLTCPEFFPVPSPKSMPIFTPIHPRSCSHQCLRPLLTHIPPFHSYHIYIYFALVTGLQLFLRPPPTPAPRHIRPRLRPLLIPILSLHSYHICIATLHRSLISSYFYAPAYSCAHAHTPSAAPIAHTNSFLSYLSYISLLSLITFPQLFPRPCLRPHSYLRPYVHAHIYAHVHTHRFPNKL